MHLFRFILSLAALFAGTLLHAQREKLTFADLKIVEEKWPTAKKTVTGLRYVIQTEGQGEPMRNGDLVSFIYRGTLIDGTLFDDGWDRLSPLSIRLGRSQVVPGMDQGLRLLKMGARAILIIPSDLAYGTRGNLPEIKPNSTLIFELEIIEVKRAEIPPTPVPASEKGKKAPAPEKTTPAPTQK